MLHIIYKVERSEEFQPEKELHFQAFCQCSITNIAMSLYSRLKTRKFE